MDAFGCIPLDNRSSVPWQQLAACALLLVGCGDAGPPLGSVSGTVLLDGKPLQGAAVIFSPKAQAADAGSSRGKTGPDGRFTLQFGSRRRGAYLGDHQVIIEHPEYFKADHVARVDAGQNTVDFALTSGGRRQRREAADTAESLPAVK
jgi:hypothetical protein